MTEFQKSLDVLAKKGRLRGRRLLPKNSIDFASNDYLGFKKDQKSFEAAVKAVKKEGLFAPSASQLVYGYQNSHKKLENTLKKMYDFEDALIVGSGFLALDKNNNGEIDNGSELFGAQSGDGFADLSLYDDTKDGVIDESDQIFSKLKVWLKNAGGGSIVSLSDVRVGALIVENVSSKFDLKEDGETLAKLRSTGLAVMEDGSGNWLSHVDFIVTESTGEGSADNGETVSTMTDLKALTDKTKLNPSDSNQTSNSEDALIEKLKKQLQEIEAKLRRTDNEGEKVKLEGEKTALTARILQIEKRASQPV
jgi:molecular chaperone GrpE (heat shock protein)